MYRKNQSQNSCFSFIRRKWIQLFYECDLFGLVEQVWTLVTRNHSQLGNWEFETDWLAYARNVILSGICWRSQFCRPCTRGFKQWDTFIKSLQEINSFNNGRPPWSIFAAIRCLISPPLRFLLLQQLLASYCLEKGWTAFSRQQSSLSFTLFAYIGIIKRSMSLDILEYWSWICPEDHSKVHESTLTLPWVCRSVLTKVSEGTASKEGENVQIWNLMRINPDQ